MAANPLKAAPSEAPATCSVEAHVAKLNNYRWVIASGKLFYVGSREMADGTIQKSVERYV
jgi:hypothetical protein